MNTVRCDCFVLFILKWIYPHKSFATTSLSYDSQMTRLGVRLSERPGVVLIDAKLLEGWQHLRDASHPTIATPFSESADNHLSRASQLSTETKISDRNNVLILRVKHFSPYAPICRSELFTDSLTSSVSHSLPPRRMKCESLRLHTDSLQVPWGASGGRELSETCPRKRVLRRCVGATSCGSSSVPKVWPSQRRHRSEESEVNWLLIVSTKLCSSTRFRICALNSSHCLLRASTWFDSDSSSIVWHRTDKKDVWCLGRLPHGAARGGLRRVRRGCKPFFGESSMMLAGFDEV